jgi:hypothetical protein
LLGAISEVDETALLQDRHRPFQPVDRDYLIRQPQLLDQLACPRLLRQPGVRAGLDDEAAVVQLDSLGEELAAGAVRGLVDAYDNIGRFPAQAVGDAESGDPSADDGHIDPRRHHARVAVCTKSTSRLTLSTGVCGSTP